MKYKAYLIEQKDDQFSGSIKELDAPSIEPIGYHTRNTDDTVAETLDITDAVASDPLIRVMLHGTVMQSFGTQSVGALLRFTPGFKDIRPTFPSKKLMESFAAQPGVRTARFSQ